MPPVTSDPWTWVQSGGVVGFAVFVVIGFIRAWIITPGRFQDVKEDRDAWRKAYEQERDARLESEKTSETILKQVELTVEILNHVRTRQQLGYKREEL
jgi:hypothetical protein